MTRLEWACAADGDARLLAAESSAFGRAYLKSAVHFDEIGMVDLFKDPLLPTAHAIIR